MELTKQELYEDLWFGKASPPTPRWLILFTARWCTPCHRLDKAAIQAAATAQGVPFYICDAAVNKYTPTFCDVNRFPTFQIMEPGRVVASLTSSDTAMVLQWLEDNHGK
jgi:hypothetical protein